MTDQREVAHTTRADIQALRAVAVGVVVVYHLIPTALPGGFVGVDVFFVISGFLITTILVNRPPTGPSDLLAFWARRIRRLLPASLLVLGVSTIASWCILPTTQWQPTARYVRAAALYVVNWVLASDAVNYLSEGSAPSVVQHYWSLAVEEQFYLIWPLLALAVFGRWSRGFRTVAMSAAVGASFAWSIHQTATNPQVAYFSTFARLWELGAGGLLAVAMPYLVRRGIGSAHWSALMAAVGWLAIATSGFVIDNASPFPGWRAVLPVAGTLLVIAASREFRWHRWRSVRWLGDVSYSVYLWHWPLTILVPAMAGAALGVRPDQRQAVIVVALTLVLAGFTKIYVEDPFRTRAWSRRVRASYVLGALGMAVILAGTVALHSVVQRQLDADRVALNEAKANADRCLGAGSLGTSLRCPKPAGPLVPSPLRAASDLPSVYERQANGEDCLSRQGNFPVIACQVGDPHGGTRVVLIGNSHAAQWVPAFEEIAVRRHWRVTTYLTSSCASSFTVPAFDTEAGSRRCVGWVKDVLDRVKQNPPDLLVVANRVGRPAWGKTSLEGSLADYRFGFRRMLEDLAASNRPIVVLRDTPIPVEAGIPSIPDCLARRSSSDRCSGPRSEWIRADPAADAARDLRDRDVEVVDVNDHFCSRTTCFGAVGGVVVYSDGHHLTATFARTMGPWLEPPLVAALKRSREMP